MTVPSMRAQKQRFCDKKLVVAFDISFIIS